MSAESPRVRRTSRGWRITQHGTVLSEVLAAPGPTHSVFDAVAAICATSESARDIALLGFGGGGVVAALRALGCRARIHAVDLDPTGFRLLRRAGKRWLSPIVWAQEDAIRWLENTGSFDIIIDDLSIPLAGDVHKPEATWTRLPPLVRTKLRPGGSAIFNLLKPHRRTWDEGYQTLTAGFSSGFAIHFSDFHNRLVVLTDSNSVPSARTLSPRAAGALVRARLRTLNSKIASRIQFQAVAVGLAPCLKNEIGAATRDSW